MTFDAAIHTASEIASEGRGLDAIRYLRRAGMTFQTARKYVAEIDARAPWMLRAAHRGRAEQRTRR